MLCLRFLASLLDGSDALELTVHHGPGCRRILLEAFTRLSRTLILCNIIDESRFPTGCGGGRPKVLYHCSEDPAGWVASDVVFRGITICKGSRDPGET
jgi:hypothetical protein